MNKIILPVWHLRNQRILRLKIFGGQLYCDLKEKAFKIQKNSKIAALRKEVPTWKN